jgi:Fic family protein
MSYLIFQKNKNKEYVYFVKKASILGKQYSLKKYVGTNKGLISKETFLTNNFNLLVKEELELRKPLWEKAQSLVYNQNLIEDIEKKAIELNNLVELKNASTIHDLEFAKEFVYNSNNIEGSRIPKEKLIELFEKGRTSYSNKNEVIEIENSIKAFEYIKYKFSFGLLHIKRLYHILTKGMFLETGQAYPHGFRKTPIVVGNESTSVPKNIEEEIKALLAWNKKNSKIMYPFQRAFDFHLQYEITHPFRDGNGRTGRLIMNKILLQNNYPPIIIFKDNKKAYFNAIKAARDGDKKKYYQFMFEQTKKTYDQMIKSLNAK